MSIKTSVPATLTMSHFLLMMRDGTHPPNRVARGAKMKVGLGVVTCDRPDGQNYFRQVNEGIEAHLVDLVDEFVVNADYQRVGCAHSKNAVMQQLLDAGCDWIFVSEDDVVVQSPLAITGYIQACYDSGLHHLSFAHHGPANVGKTPNEMLAEFKS